MSKSFANSIAGLFLCLIAPSMIAPVDARDIRNWKDCMSEDIDVGISGCTALLEGGERLTEKSRANVHGLRASSYLKKGDYSRAIVDLDVAIRSNPKDWLSWASRGSAYFEEGSYERSAADYDEAIRLHPQDAGLYNLRGSAFLRTGNNDQALRDFNQSIRLKPRADHYDSRGTAFRMIGDHDRAIRDFDEAVRLEPNYAEAYHNRGLTYRDKGDDESAILDLDKAIRLDPDSAVAYLDRAQIYERKGEIDRARVDLRTALKRGKGNYSVSKPELEKAYQTARERLRVLDQAPLVNDAAAPSARLTAVEAAERGPRIALVIGNGAYANVPTLQNPPNDARDISAALRDLGFRVIEGYNLDGTAMRAKIADFGAALPGAAVSLFYYAGHGIQVAGKNYLIPIDAKLERPSSLGVEAVEVNTVLSDMEAEKRVNLLFLDACRDNPLTRSLAKSLGTSRSAAVGQGLAQLNAGIGTLITFATSPDTVALDGSGRNSPFTSAMLKHIGTPGLEIRSMLTRVRSDVIKATNEQQVPWDHSSLTGDFFLRTGG